MSSILKVDTIQDQAGNNIINESGNVITIGASGDTITVPAGATVSGFTSAGIDDNATSTAITISSAEDVTFTEDILLGDSKKALFGAGSDLQIYHDGSHSFIADEGTGNLTIKSNGAGIELQKGDSEYLARFKTDNAVELYYDNAKKFETTATGATVTGVASASGAFLSTVNNSLLTFGGGNAGNVGSNLTMYGGANGSTGDFRFRNATTINAFITAAGQIQGIGGAVSAPTFSFTADTDTGISRPTTNALNFVTAGAERARIDASGNLLVGKTSTTNSVPGSKFGSGGQIVATVANDDIMILNRTGSDGKILRFFKDTSEVGSISAIGGDLTIQSTTSGHEGLRFGNGAIVPVNTAGASTNIECTLGGATSRFNNLYLGGGLYVGGTGTANKLDDYEEGTWTPTYVPDSGSFTSVTYANATVGDYTKIGNVVTFTFYIQTNAITVGTASGGVAIGGLPFTPNGGTVSNGGGTVINRAFFAGDGPAYGTASGTKIFLYYNTGSTANDIVLNVTDLGTGGTDNVFQMVGQYLTDS